MRMNDFSNKQYNRDLDERSYAKEKEQEDEYYSFIDECALLSKDAPISNGKPSHAVYLLRKFFDFSEDTVRIFTGKLTRACNVNDESIPAYSDSLLLSSIKDFLSRSGSDGKRRLVIVSEDEIDGGVDDHPLVREAISLHESGNLNADVDIRVLTEEGKKDVSDIGINFHFAVKDDTAYRIESDKDKYRAVANFGDFRFAKKLAKLFDLAFIDSGDSKTVKKISANMA